MAHITGHPDLPPLPLSGSVDLRVGTAAAFATLAALYHRGRTGEGQHIDLSSTEIMSSMMGEVFLGYEMSGQIPERMGNRDITMAPHNCYRCRDEGRWVTIAVGSEEEWAALKRALGDPALDEAGFGDPASRWRNQAHLDPIIERWTVEREVAEVVKTLQAAGVASLPVNSGAQISRDPQVQELGILQNVEHPLLGEKAVVGAPWTFSNASVGVRRPRPPPWRAQPLRPEQHPRPPRLRDRPTRNRRHPQLITWGRSLNYSFFSSGGGGPQRFEKKL